MYERIWQRHPNTNMVENFNNMLSLSKKRGIDGKLRYGLLERFSFSFVLHNVTKTSRESIINRKTNKIYCKDLVECN